MNKEDYELIDLHYILYGYYMISNTDSFNNKQIPGGDTIIDIDKNEAQSESTEIVIKQEVNNTEIVSKLSVYHWNSAIILLDNIYNTLDDLIHNNGVIYKILLNSFIDSQNKAKPMTKELEDKTETDPVESLISNLKKCKNRKEKKILLAKFNNVLGIAWGDNKKILPKDAMKEILSLPIESILENKV